MAVSSISARDARGEAHIRIWTHNIFAVRAGWEDRRRVLIDGIRKLEPDLVNLQETMVTQEYDQVADILGTGFHIVHSRAREAGGQGISIGSRWPIAAVHELDLSVVSARTGDFACTAPAGDREIELIAAKLENGESTAIRATNPALVIVLSGAATVGDDDLTAGDAAIRDGTIDIEANEDGTRVLVAVIGAEIPAAASVPAPDASASPVATQVPTSNDASANSSKILVLTALCPAGVTIEQAQDTSAGDPCFAGGAVAGMVVTITNKATGESFSTGVDPANATAAFFGLPAGPDQVVLDSGPDLGHSVGICGGQDSSADLPLVEFNASVVNLDLPAEREHLCSSRTVQLGDDAGSSEPTNTGSITASFYACPAGMTFATLDAAQCTIITDGFDFGLQGETDLHLAEASFDGTAFTWSGLTVSQDMATGVSYLNTVCAYPAGYDWFAFTVDGTTIQEPHAGGFVLTPGQPSAAIAVFFISHQPLVQVPGLWWAPES